MFSYNKARAAQDSVDPHRASQDSNILSYYNYAVTYALRKQ